MKTNRESLKTLLIILLILLLSLWLSYGTVLAAIEWSG
jgi:hypothetical protein